MEPRPLGASRRQSRQRRSVSRPCHGTARFERSRSSAITCPASAASPRSPTTCARRSRPSTPARIASSCRSTTSPEGYDYPGEVRFEIEEQELDSYLRAADFLNFANADIVCLQHEYGIFGGPAGSHVVRLLREPADADRHDPAHRAPRAQRRPAAGARPGRRAVGPAGGDVRAGADVPPRDLRRPRGQDRPDRPRHPRHAVRRPRTSTRTSSGSRGSTSR